MFSVVAIWFFFSSRRRHTRFDCDWSSDVCSSDLEAEQRLEQAIAVYRVKPDLAGVELGGALHNLGLVRIGQRRTAEGQVLLEQAVQIYAKNLRPDDLNMAQGYLDLAIAYKIGGRPQEAQEMDGKALRIQEQVFGMDSPVTRETRARIKQNSNREQLQNPQASGKPPIL